MEDQPKFERMLRMALMLSSGRKMTLVALAERFEISVRSASRYIATFRRAGLVVDCDHGVYMIRKFEKPFHELQELLHFSEEEAYVLLRAIQSIDNTNILKANLVKKLYSLYNHDSVADTVVNPEQAGIVHSLITAIRSRRQVILCQYRSSHGNIVRDRLVEPFDFSANYISFWAFEPESRSCKLFSTARVEQVTLLDKPDRFTEFHRKDPIDVFRISSDKAYPVKLRLSMRARNLLTEEYPLAEPFLTSAGDNFWHFTTDVRGFEGVGRFVLGLGGEVHVIESEEFKAYLRAQVKNFNNLF